MPHRDEDRFFGDRVGLGSVEPQGHDRGVDVWIGGFSICEELLVDQLEPLRALEHQVGGDQGIEPGAFVRIAAADHRLELDCIGFGPADSQHGVVESFAIRGNCRVADPLHELFVIHLALEFLDIFVRRQRELVVAIASQERVGVLEMLLEKLQAGDRILRKLLDRFDVFFRIGRQGQGGGPHQVAWIDSQEQELLFGLSGAKVIGFDLLALLKKGLSTQDSLDEKRRVAVDIDATVGHEGCDSHGIHRETLLAERLRGGRTERAATLLGPDVVSI